MPKPDYRLINDRHPVEDVLQRLGMRVKGGTFRCKFHDDHTESGSVFRGDDGRVRWKCHACGIGGDSVDLAKAELRTSDDNTAIEWLTGRDPSMRGPDRPRRTAKPGLVFDLVPIPQERLVEIRAGHATPELLHKNGSRRAYRPVMIHHYRDGDGQVQLIIARVIRQDGSKLPLPIRLDRQHGWVSTRWRKDEKPLLYRGELLGVHRDRPVLVVEGEKCVDLLGALPDFDDYVVISWAGGAEAHRMQDWSPLKGRDVLFWPDADLPKEGQAEGPGIKAMRWIAEHCEAATLWMVEPDPDWIARDIGFDAADLLEELKDGGAVLEAMRQRARPYRPEPPEEPPPEGPQPGPDDDLPWVYKFTRQGGQTQRVIDPRDESNLVLWLARLPPERGGYAGRLSRDAFTNDVLLDGRILDEGMGVRRIVHSVAVTRVLQGLTADKTRPVIADVADRTKVNPLANELRALVWDGVDRDLLAYAGVDTEGESGLWARVAGWRWLVGMVHRLLEPGWQHDGVLVLEGRQGTGKTSFFRLFGQIRDRDLFLELDRLSRHPDVQMQLKGKAIVELSEMTAQRKGDTDVLKGMLSSTRDTYRRPYGRKPEEVPRTCVFCGTTNEREYLRDMTGNRRYWIVPVTREMDLAGLVRDRDQLLAQAVHAIDKGEQNWLTEDEIALQEAMAASRVEAPAQLDHLDDVLAGAGSTLSLHELWEILHIPPDRRSNTLKRGLTWMMEQRGWKYGKRHRSGSGPHQSRAWKRPDSADP